MPLNPETHSGQRLLRPFRPLSSPNRSARTFCRNDRACTVQSRSRSMPSCWKSSSRRQTRFWRRSVTSRHNWLLIRAISDALTTLRRSAHTLKGSGRMVGLTDMGDAAWALEQTLNMWLRQDMVVTPELLALITEAHKLFSRWVAALEHRSCGYSRIRSDNGRARRRLLRGEEPRSPAPVPSRCRA